MSEKKGRLSARPNYIPRSLKTELLILTVILFVTTVIVLIIGRLPYHRYSTGMTGATVSYEVGRVTDVLSESLQDSEVEKGLLTGS